MDRMFEIKTKLESNSKLMSKYSLRIQELKEEIDKIDSQIKWVPAVALDEQGEKDARDLRGGVMLPGGGVVAAVVGLITSCTPSEADARVKASRVIELVEKRVPLQKELDDLIFRKELLRKENLSLREELQSIKNSQNI